MEILSINLSSKVRQERWNGRDWLVAPVRMLQEQVLSGSQGPLLYPQAEISKNPTGWNGIPITLRHPSLNGTPVSARSPKVLEQQGIGYVFAAHTKKGPLDAEAWIDRDKFRSLEPQLCHDFENGKAISVSTGLYTDNIPAEPGAAHNGRHYAYTATGYRPDHLAVLPYDQTGACSVQDGCGLFVGNNGETEPIDGTTLNSDPSTLSQEDVSLAERLVTDLIDDGPTVNIWSQAARVAAARARKAGGRLLGAFAQKAKRLALKAVARVKRLPGKLAKRAAGGLEKLADKHAGLEEAHAATPADVRRSEARKSRGKGAASEDTRKKLRELSDKGGKETIRQFKPGEAVQAGEAYLKKRKVKAARKALMEDARRSSKIQKAKAKTGIGDSVSEKADRASRMTAADKTVGGGRTDQQPDKRRASRSPDRQVLDVIPVHAKDIKAKNKPKKSSTRDSSIKLGGKKVKTYALATNALASLMGIDLPTFNRKKCKKPKAQASYPVNCSSCMAAVSEYSGMCLACGLLHNAELKGGEWVTTQGGHRIYVQGGQPIAGNPTLLKQIDEWKELQKAKKTTGDSVKNPKKAEPEKDKEEGGKTENALPNQPRSRETGKYKWPNAGTGSGDAHHAAQAGHMMLTDLDRELGEEAVLDYADQGENPAGWAVDEGKWKRAKAAATEGNYSGDTYWAVVAHIYQNMGGKVGKRRGQTQNAGEPTINAKVTGDQFIKGKRKGQFKSGFKGCVAKFTSEGKPADMAQGLCATIARRKGKAPGGKNYKPKAPTKNSACCEECRQGRPCKGKKMASNASYPAECPHCGGRVNQKTGVCSGCGMKTKMGSSEAPTGNQETPMNRDQMISYLTTNCSCWKEKGAVLANKELLTDDDLRRLVADARLNQERTAVVNSLRSELHLGDGVALNAMPAALAEALAKKGKGPMAGKKKGKKMDDEEAEDEMDDEEEEGEPTGNRKTLSPEEWLAAAPPEMREVWNSNVRFHDAQLAKLRKDVETLAANTANPSKKARLEALLGSNPTINQLQAAYDLAAEAQPINNGFLMPGQGADPTPNYGGMGLVPQTINRLGGDLAPSEQADHLYSPPTLDFEELARNTSSKQRLAR